MAPDRPDLSTYPKDRKANIAYREQVLAWAANNPARQAEVRQRCKEDLLFFLNVFGWVAEQRKDIEGKIKLPFLTFDYQDAVLRRLEANLGKKFIIGDKSRDMGFTWMVLYLFLWRWLFYPLESFGVASRTEEYVDKRGSPDSHFWKLDFALRGLPFWLMPRQWKRTKKQLLNLDLQSDITGYATSKDIARGGRRLAILLDELAAYHYVDGKGCWASCALATDCIIAVSTHQGTVGAFADACRSAARNSELFEHIVVRWWEDPRKNQGLAFVDPEHPLPGMSIETLKDRPGGRWSPWFERMCAKLHYDKKMIAQELEGDPSAAGYGFFSAPLLDAAKKLGCRPPSRVGRLIYDRETREPLNWVDDSNGNIRLWCDLIGGKPPIDAYAAGCDISAGVGTNPSVIAIGSKTLGCKIAEFYDRNRVPANFVGDMCAVAKWFNNAQLIWERMGPGGKTIGKKLIEWGYLYLYLPRTNEGELIEKVTTNVGFTPDREGVKTLLESWRDALGSGEYLERSEETLDECREYRYGKDGGVEHAESKETDDPTKTASNHGDRAMATALMWKLIVESNLMPSERKSEAKWQPAPVGSFMYFVRQDLERQYREEVYGGLNLG